jgi:MarR family transcriptional regulator, lower aerobic nicotinate degradation pathway regulator
MASRSSLPSALPHSTDLNAVDGLAQLSFLILNTLARRAAQHGVSIIQTRLLGVLRDREPGMNELAALLDLDKSSVTGLVDRAEQRGLVERVPSPLDRRAVLVRLTTQGRSLVSEVGARFEADVSALLDLVPQREAAALSRVISRLLVVHASERGVDLWAGVHSGPAHP